MKETLYKYLERYFDFWKQEIGKLPITCTDDTDVIELYRGQIDVEGYIQWQYMEYKEKTNFNIFKDEYDFILSETIIEYYTSYCFLSLEGFFQKNYVCLKRVTKNSAIYIQPDIEPFEEKELIDIGLYGPEPLQLCFSNNTGKVVAHDWENERITVICDSLKEFIENLKPSLKN